MHAETRYARNGNIHIAYQVCGAGPLDVIMIPGFTSHGELMWEMPFLGPKLRRIATFARLICIDKRGTGLSDRNIDVPSLEQSMDDVSAVMGAVGSERAVLWGISEGGPMSMLLAATHPDRMVALVIEGSFARIVRAPDYPWGYPPEALAETVAGFEAQWGTGAVLARFLPSAAGDRALLDQLARYERNSASPGAIAAIVAVIAQIDVRPILPTIIVPTLVLHHTRDPVVAVEHGRYLAAHIPGARIVELPGLDHASLGPDPGGLDDVEEFLTGARPAAAPERVLATVLFTDIVGSTDRAGALGDARWRALLDRHDEVVRREIGRFRGREVQHTGDGFLIAFDGPARAVACAAAIVEALRPIGLDIRAGVHTGECERRGDNLGGIAVHIGARVAAVAGAREVLVSRTVRDLVAGSRVPFSDRGEHELKGVPETWQLYALETFGAV